jgi:hypothetical protein
MILKNLIKNSVLLVPSFALSSSAAVMRNILGALGPVVLSLLISPLMANAQSSCRYILLGSNNETLSWSKGSAEISKIQSTWGPQSFSDPRHHDPSDFRYIVRVDAGSSTNEIVEAAKSISSGETKSGSVISERFTGTYYYAEHVFILSVPAKNVLAANRVDMQSGMDQTVKSALAQREYFGLGTPTELLRQTVDLSGEHRSDEADPQFLSMFGGFRWNEVKFLTKSESGQIGVIGIVFFPTRAKRKASEGRGFGYVERERKKLQDASERLGVPLIELN